MEYMAPSDSVISVLVVDGEFAALHKFGFPLPALATMQEAGARLTDASWNVRKSCAGLSLSFFWPSSSPAVAQSQNHVVSHSAKMRREG